MSGSWTPGPWKTADRYGSDGWRVMAAGNVVATAPYLGGTEPAKVNANLIAAAPELFEALTEAVFVIGSGQLKGPGAHALATSFRAALAKARGES